MPPTAPRTEPWHLCPGRVFYVGREMGQSPFPPTIRRPFSFVYLTESMTKPPVSSPVRSATPKDLCPTGEEMVCAFNEVRIALVSTLYYVLGNYEDAQDAAQDAFLKCWRSRHGIGEVGIVRAWI